MYVRPSVRLVEQEKKQKEKKAMTTTKANVYLKMKLPSKLQ